MCHACGQVVYVQKFITFSSLPRKPYSALRPFDISSRSPRTDMIRFANQRQIRMTAPSTPVPTSSLEATHSNVIMQATCACAQDAIDVKTEILLLQGRSAWDKSKVHGHLHWYKDAAFSPPVLQSNKFLHG